jgi:hypothetical protein
MTEPSGYVLEPLREGAEFTLYRGRQHGDPSPVLVVALTAEQPSPQDLRRISANSRSRPNLIPRGQLSRWRSLVTKGGRFSYFRTLPLTASTVPMALPMNIGERSTEGLRSQSPPLRLSR